MKKAPVFLPCRWKAGSEGCSPLLPLFYRVLGFSIARHGFQAGHDALGALHRANAPPGSLYPRGNHPQRAIPVKEAKPPAIIDALPFRC